MNKSLFLIRGIPGSGKSSLANLLSENGKYPVLSADMYFEDSDGNYDFDVRLLSSAHKWCKSECELIIATWEVFIGTTGKTINCANSGFFKRFETADKIFIANTFTTESEMQPYFDLAKKYDYTVFTMIVENRHGNKNTHNVPDETITKMRNRFNVQL